MITSKFEYKLPFDTFTPDEFGSLVAEAKQLVTELNNGDADLPGELDTKGAYYWSKLNGPLFLTLGINRPLPDGVSPWTTAGEETDGLRIAFESRLSLETGFKIRGSLQDTEIGSDDEPETIDVATESAQ